MTDFLFLGSDVSLFRHSIKLYADYLPVVVCDYEFNVFSSKYEDLMELYNSGFNSHEFRFPVEFADLVLEALSYYSRLCRERSKRKAYRGQGYGCLYQKTITLIAQINLMLELNDDD